MSASAPEWDRFARWPPGLARLALAALAALVAAALVVPIHAGRTVRTRSIIQQVTGTGRDVPPRPRDRDLALYDRIIARVASGDDYYDAAIAEQRRGNYPVRPGIAVRLPTLAYLCAWLGVPGRIIVAAALTLAVIAAWWRRLLAEPGGREHVRVAVALTACGSALGLNTYYLVMHELWAGLLMALALALHRVGARPGQESAGQESPGQDRWRAALAAAALALAIRETALPFVLLMAALALWRRAWTEAAAWITLAAVFAAGLAWHLHLVDERLLPGDRVSASWLAMRGLSGWLSDVVLTGSFSWINHRVGAVLAVLSLVGWAQWRSWAGVYGFWLFAGYAVFFMIAGRWDNFYWGMIVAPAMLTALVFAPRALLSLLRAAAPARALAT